MAYKFRYFNCNVCGSKNRVYLGKRIPRTYYLDKYLQTDIVKCKNCGLIYPYPMPSADDKQIEDNFSNPETYFPEIIPEERFKLYDSFLKKIEKLVDGKRGKFLDVGCGRGELLYLAKSYGWEVYGVDISSNFAKYAKERFNIDVKVGDIRNMDFPSESFDVICLISAFDHVYDPHGLIVELNRVIKKGGIVFMEIMDNESLPYKLGDLFYRLQGKKITTRLSPTFPSFQIYGFSIRSISYLLHLSGFKVIKIWVRGGASRRGDNIIKSFKEKLLRVVRILCFIIANLLNKGQVLEICARKDR